MGHSGLERFFERLRQFIKNLTLIKLHQIPQLGKNLFHHFRECSFDCNAIEHYPWIPAQTKLEV